MLNNNKKHFKIGVEVLDYHLKQKIFQYSKHFELLNVYDSLKSVTKESLIKSDIPNKHIPRLIDDSLFEIHKSITLSCQNVQIQTLGCFWTNLDIVELYDLYSAFIIGTEHTDKFVIRNTETLYSKLRNDLLIKFSDFGQHIHKSLFDEFKFSQSINKKYLKYFIGYAFEFKIANQREAVESFSDVFRAIIYADMHHYYCNEFFDFHSLEKEDVKYQESNLSIIYNDSGLRCFEDIENVWHLEKWITESNES